MAYKKKNEKKEQVIAPVRKRKVKDRSSGVLTYSKSHIFERISQKTNYPVNALWATYSLIEDEITTIFEEGNSVSLPGLGTFDVVYGRKKPTFNVNSGVRKTKKEHEMEERKISIKYTKSRTLVDELSKNEELQSILRNEKTDT